MLWTTPVPRVDRVVVPVTVKVDDRDVGLLNTMLPVVLPPSVKVWRLVVARLPVAVRNVPPVVPAESVAVGVLPALIPVTANRALLVAVLPSRRSSVVFLSKIEPLPSLNGDPPFTTGKMPEM